MWWAWYVKLGPQVRPPQHSIPWPCSESAPSHSRNGMGASCLGRNHVDHNILCRVVIDVYTWEHVLAFSLSNAPEIRSLGRDQTSIRVSSPALSRSLAALCLTV
jgi:hypothetical protein